MNLAEFKNKVIVLGHSESDKIREKYIIQFIDKNTEYYKENILRTYEYVDGKCYSGYLWDCLKNPTIKSEKTINNIIDNLHSRSIYVMWDIHTKERIFIEDYWKFDKRSVLKISADIFLKGEKYLPEDVYIFDDSMEWSIIKTHEEIDNERFCLSINL